MAGHRYGTRLDQLLRLRDRLDAEIKAERRNRARDTQAENRLYAPAQLVRAWARKNGIPVNTRGSVSADLRDQYLEATQGDRR